MTATCTTDCIADLCCNILAHPFWESPEPPHLLPFIGMVSQKKDILLCSEFLGACSLIDNNRCGRILPVAGHFIKLATFILLGGLHSAGLNLCDEPLGDRVLTGGDDVFYQPSGMRNAYA